MGTMTTYAQVDLFLLAWSDADVCEGPREVTIFDADAIEPILGVNSKTKKGPFYGSLQQSLHMTRDPDFHAKRRKVWDTAFKQSE